jgi:hypothetical protein
LNQLLIKEDTSVELEDFYVILLKNIKKDSKTPTKIRYDLHRWLMNPRYFENGLRLKDAQINLDARNPRFTHSLIRIC